MDESDGGFRRGKQAAIGFRSPGFFEHWGRKDDTRTDEVFWRRRKFASRKACYGLDVLLRSFRQVSKRIRRGERSMGKEMRK